jgi:hypothetical protein
MVKDVNRMYREVLKEASLNGKKKHVTKQDLVIAFAVVPYASITERKTLDKHIRLMEDTGWIRMEGDTVVILDRRSLST